MNGEQLVGWGVRLLGVYAGVGLLFAIAFVARGAARIDRAAAGATIGFRLIVLPAAMALWPWLLGRWLRAKGTPPVERNAHRRAARCGGTS